MSYNVTHLVNNIILPATEPDDILGIERIHDVVSWVILPNAEPVNLALGYSTGGVISMILIEGTVFVGTANKLRDDVDVKGIAERIKAHTSFEESTQ